jgi:hypothetical protein
MNRSPIIKSICRKIEVEKTKTKYNKNDIIHKTCLWKKLNKHMKYCIVDKLILSFD